MTDLNNGAGTLSTEKVLYRGYVKLNEKGEIEDINAKQVTNNQKAEDAKLKKLTEGGYSLHNENEIVKYTVLSKEGINTLVPDEAQQLYIFNAGLAYIQNSKANGKMTQLEDDGVTPSFNGVEIDLKEALNEPPQKRSLTPEEKISRQFAALGVSDDEKKRLLAFLAQQFASQTTADTGADAAE